MAEPLHAPVMVREVVELLSGAETVVDLTVGAGGHAAALLDSGVRRVIGVDRDPDAIAAATDRLSGYGERVQLTEGRFSEVLEVAEEAGVRRADGVLYDLGVSSMQLDRAARGFSFREAGPLDMRMGPEGPGAAEVVNEYSEAELERVLREHGEERFARRIAAAIVRARSRAPLQSTRELAAVVAAAVPKRRGGPHPARRAFQAIRIEVNREIEELAASLPRVVQLLAPGGRLVVISYHSLEDRVVKHRLRDDENLEVLTRKPMRPSEEEAASNPRARSAKLRAAERKAD
ncbi:MAG: 16S rRNA (cytosine(1402)-N(4))-methyltransferase RsmH [Actinomycetota bacterium]